MTPVATGAPTCDDFTFDGVIDRTPTDGKLVFVATAQDYIDGTFVPGTYEVTIRGTPNKATDNRVQDATFNIVLTDSCDPPVSITVVEHVDMDHTLTKTPQL